ncbi:hypothetical protein AVEN_224442-1 [Araneus ventricosus]|uniref:Uncharacterized protein n=1 Tax=Araneus ventricosus TaxID=182803 RepID=A0A4Y2KBV7_ARAVE|nr:hypothetical protein AVEN_224442-1 [Araneus ventricosus]
MSLSSPNSLLTKVQLTALLGLKAYLYTFPTESDVISRRFETFLAPSRDRTIVQDFSRRFLLSPTLVAKVAKISMPGKQLYNFVTIQKLEAETKRMNKVTIYFLTQKGTFFNS